MCTSFLVFSDLCDSNETIDSHGEGTFIEIKTNGHVVMYNVRRKRIKPSHGDLRSLFIENRNLHSLPNLCHGALVSAMVKDELNIACISCWCKEKFSFFFLEETNVI